MMRLEKELGKWRAELRPMSGRAEGAVLSVNCGGVLVAVNAWASGDEETALAYFSLICAGINAAQRIADEQEERCEAVRHG